MLLLLGLAIGSMQSPALAANSTAAAHVLQAVLFWKNDCVSTALLAAAFSIEQLHSLAWPGCSSII